MSAHVPASPIAQDSLASGEEILRDPGWWSGGDAMIRRETVLPCRVHGLNQPGVGHTLAAEIDQRQMQSGIHDRAFSTRSRRTPNRRDLAP